MSIERTRPLSLEDSAAILKELRSPPADTPERRAMFERVRRWEERLNFERCGCASEEEDR